MTVRDALATLVREGMPPELRPVTTELGIALGAREAPPESLRASAWRGGGHRSRAGQVSDALHLRWYVWTEHFARCRDYLHSTDWTRYPAAHVEVWERYCLSGLEPQEIAAAMGMGLRAVRHVLEKHRRLAELRAGIVAALQRV